MYLSNLFVTLLCVFLIGSTGLKVAHRRHHVPPLILDGGLNQGAQQWAQTLVSQGSMTHSQSGGKYGENLYMEWTTGGSLAYRPGTASNSWYTEIKSYNFNNPGFSAATGHFTQVVWKGSTRVGFGYASNGKTNFVVARYSPPGNYLGQFPQNVLRA